MLTNAKKPTSKKNEEERAHRKGLALREWLIVLLTASSFGFSAYTAYSNSQESRRFLTIAETQAKALQTQADASKEMASIAGRQENISGEQKNAMRDLARLGQIQSQSGEKQAQAMLLSSQYQKASASDQKKLVSESQRANILADDAIYQQNRPWVSVSNLTVTYDNKKNIYHFQFTVLNFGRTPALNVRTNTQESFNKIEGDKELIMQPGSCLDSRCQKSILFTNQSINTNRYIDKNILNEDSLNRMKNGTKFYFNILIEYEDNFGFTHYTRNCVFYEFDFNMNKPCAFGNEAT